MEDEVEPTLLQLKRKLREIAEKKLKLGAYREKEEDDYFGVKAVQLTLAEWKAELKKTRMMQADQKRLRLGCDIEQDEYFGVKPVQLTLAEWKAELKKTRMMQADKSAQMKRTPSLSSSQGKLMWNNHIIIEPEARKEDYFKGDAYIPDNVRKLGEVNISKNYLFTTSECSPTRVPFVESDDTIFSLIPPYDDPFLTVTGADQFPGFMVQGIEAALKIYNEKNPGADFNLLDMVDFDIVRKYQGGQETLAFAHHINFWAQSQHDPSTKVLFFAEGHLNHFPEHKYGVVVLRPVDPIKAGSATCQFCAGMRPRPGQKKIKHPEEGFYGAISSLSRDTC